MIARSPVDWGSDEYDDPASVHNQQIAQRGGSQQSGSDYYHSISPVSPQYADMEQNTELQSTMRPPLPTPPSEGNQAQNSEYCAVYQDPAQNMSRPSAATPTTSPIYSDTYQDPTIGMNMTRPPSQGSKSPTDIYSDTYQDPTIGMSMTLPPGEGSTTPTDVYSETYQDPVLTAATLPSNMDLRPMYEVPAAVESGASNRQYSVLRKQESDESVY